MTTPESPDKPTDRHAKLELENQVMNDLRNLFEMLKTMLESTDQKVFGKCPEAILAIAPHLTPELKHLGFERITQVMEGGKSSEPAMAIFAMRVDFPTVEKALERVKENRQRIDGLNKRAAIPGDSSA